jgi:vacuolar iron transporter family protein
MPQTPHIERHFTASDTIRDIIIGMSDGLTVPFALAAGLSSANAATAVVVTAGLAEIAAGSVSMGLGGYLAARNDADHYDSERLREEREIVELPQAERMEVKQVFQAYGLSDEQSDQITEALAARPQAWVDFMMRFELGLEKPERRRALVSALTIAGAYIVGGFVPLSPYILLPEIQTAQIASVVATLMALVVFGYIKGRLTGTYPLRSALQTMLVGGVAAFVAFGIAKVVS